MAKCLFIAATGKDVGKTSISLSLIHLLSKRYKRIGYIKPISQRFIQFSESKVGDDPVLIKEIFDLKNDINDMSPVVIDGDFTERVIKGTIKTSFPEKIRNAYENIKKETDFIIIEGAGHAGVGAVIGQSNADIAKMLNADVLLIGGGGIGRAIDKMMLDKTFFEASGCNVIGVLINKVFENKYKKVSPLLRKWFQEKQIPLFGILPYYSFLSSPKLSFIMDETNAFVLNGKRHLDRKIEKVIVGSTDADSMLELLKSLKKETLLITSSDRIDFLLEVFTDYFKNISNSNKLAGILFSGNESTSKKVKEIFRKVDMPVLMADKDVYELASTVSSLRPKMTFPDNENVNALKNLAEEYIDINKLCENLNSVQNDL